MSNDLVPDPDPRAAAAMIARLRDENAMLRRAHEGYARERIAVEHVLGHSIHAGQLAEAVKAAIYREREA